MTSPIAVVNLNWDGHDLARPDLDVFFDLAEGLDTLPEVRGEDQLIPFRAGRLPSSRLPHRRPIVANGHIAGTAGASARASFRAYVDEVKGWMDPTAGERVLVATLEDGSTRWITCAARNLLPGDGWAGEYRAMSLEWEAVSDPLWHASNGFISLDSGLVMDAALALDQDGWVVIIPTADPHVAEFHSLGNADVTSGRVEIDGPSTAAIRVGNLNTPEFINFTFPALTAGQTLVVDSGLRTVTLNGVNARGSLGLGANNQRGEYLRLRPGVNTLQILGHPAEVRVFFTPAYW